MVNAYTNKIIADDRKIRKYNEFKELISSRSFDVGGYKNISNKNDTSYAKKKLEKFL